MGIKGYIGAYSAINDVCFLLRYEGKQCQVNPFVSHVRDEKT
jgi:hypothetical protein